MAPSLNTLAFIDGLGGGEMVLIFFVILLLFGGQRLPELARGLGKSIREFKKATAGVEEEIKRALDEPAPAPAKKKPVYTPPPATLIEPAAPPAAPEQDSRQTPPPADKPAA